MFPVLTHTLQGVVLTVRLLNLSVNLVNLHLQRIDLCPQVADSLLIDVHLDSR